MAIPTLMADNGFETLQRVWFLEKRQGQSEEGVAFYHLLGKQIMAGSSVKQIFRETKETRVFGPFQNEMHETVQGVGDHALLMLQKARQAWDRYGEFFRELGYD